MGVGAILKEGFLGSAWKSHIPHFATSLVVSPPPHSPLLLVCSPGHGQTTVV